MRLNSPKPCYSNRWSTQARKDSFSRILTFTMKKCSNPKSKKYTKSTNKSSLYFNTTPQLNPYVGPIPNQVSSASKALHTWLTAVWKKLARNQSGMSATNPWMLSSTGTVTRCQVSREHTQSKNWDTTVSWVSRNSHQPATSSARRPKLPNKSEAPKCSRKTTTWSRRKRAEKISF